MKGSAHMDGTEQRILEASIAVIEEFGFKNTTVRRIAAKAGVNIASINYYFRTKEQLIDKVIEMIVYNTFDWSELSYTDNLPPKEQLFAVMEHLTRGAQNFTEIARALFFEAMVNGAYDTPAIKEMNRFMETLCQKMICGGCKMAEKDLRYAVAQIFMTGYFSVGVVPNICQPFLNADLTNDNERRKFLRHLIDRMILE